MRKNNRNSIASMGKLPQFTTMNVIDGQAGLVNYSSLIFYSLTIDIAEEKEIIDTSVAQAVNADVMGNLEKNKLQEKLNANAGNGKWRKYRIKNYFYKF